MNIEIKQIENINKTLFNIYDDKNIFPTAVSINGENYRSEYYKGFYLFVWKDSVSV